MITVEVKGFQSIADATLQIDGFTVLVGRTNIGKSAFIRAIRCALTNPTGTSFVRHGRDCARKSRKNAKSCDCFSSVRIVTDGFDLLWEKGDKVNRYTFNGQEYDKPDRGLPDFLANAGFSPVKVGDKVGPIQISDQFFPIFLLDQSGTAIAEAISDVSKLDNINAATKLVEKDRREIVSTRRVRDNDIRELETKLSLYDSLDEKLLLVRDAEEFLLDISRQESKVQTLSRHLKSLEAFESDLLKLSQASKVEVPDASPLAQSSASVVKMGALVEEAARRVRDVKVLEEVNRALQEFPDDSLIPEAASKVENLRGWIVRLKRIKEGFASFKAVESLDIPDPSQLVSIVDKLKSLASFASRCSVLTKDSSGLQKTLSEFEKEEEAIQKQLEPLNKALAEIKVCPTCSQPLKGSHLHAETLVSLSD